MRNPLAVARALLEEGGVTDAEVIAAGLLHDSIEDTTTVHDDLLEEFGTRVASLVAHEGDAHLHRNAAKVSVPSASFK